MTRMTALVMIAMVAPVFAAEKVAAKPVGKWEREVSGHKIAFTFNADGSVKIAVDADGRKIDVSGEYGVTKGGAVYGVMTKVATDVADGPEEGDLFGFKFSIADKELTVSDLKGTRVSDGARKLVEGTYTKK